MPKDDPAAPPVTAAGIRDALLAAYERIPDAIRPNLAVAASFDILNA